MCEVKYWGFNSTLSSTLGGSRVSQSIRADQLQLWFVVEFEGKKRKKQPCCLLTVQADGCKLQNYNACQKKSYTSCSKRGIDLSLHLGVKRSSSSRQSLPRSESAQKDLHSGGERVRVMSCLGEIISTTMSIIYTAVNHICVQETNSVGLELMMK